MAFVVAENNDFEESKRYRSNTNMAFGKCVIGSVNLRQECYADELNLSRECIRESNLNNAQSTFRNQGAFRHCISNYNADKKECKDNFKKSKVECVKNYKPGFWERMRYSLK